jgi:hypothetical protein
MLLRRRPGLVTLLMPPRLPLLLLLPLLWRPYLQTRAALGQHA